MRAASPIGLLFSLLTPLFLAPAWPVLAEPPAVEALIRQGIVHNLAGDYDAADRAWAGVRALAPASPAAGVHEIGTLFARMSFRNEDRSFDAKITQRVEEAVRLAEARIAANAEDAEAHYYRGYARFHHARLHAVRGDLYTGGATGEQARRDLERALEIAPSLQRAKLPLGMYLYYASALPGALRMMNWLWFVPKGSADQGLAYLHELQAAGGTLAEEAEWVLTDIYEDFVPERRAEGLALVRGLSERYPRNELMRMQELFILARMGRPAQAQAVAAKLAARLDGEPEHARIRAVARVWEARAAIEAGDAAAGRAALRSLEADPGDAPPWLEAFVRLAEGQLADASGDRELARGHYEAVVALEPPKRAGYATRLAEGYLRKPFRVGVAASD
jgi:tetratricopeptide (TPR) repeat protein